MSWATVRAPRITEVTANWAPTQARATCTELTPYAFATSPTASTTAQVRSPHLRQAEGE